MPFLNSHEIKGKKNYRKNNDPQRIFDLNIFMDLYYTVSSINCQEIR